MRVKCEVCLPNHLGVESEKGVIRVSFQNNVRSFFCELTSAQSLHTIWNDSLARDHLGINLLTRNFNNGRIIEPTIGLDSFVDSLFGPLTECFIKFSGCSGSEITINLLLNYIRPLQFPELEDFPCARKVWLNQGNKTWVRLPKDCRVIRNRCRIRL